MRIFTNAEFHSNRELVNKKILFTAKKKWVLPLRLILLFGVFFLMWFAWFLGRPSFLHDPLAIVLAGMSVLFVWLTFLHYRLTSFPRFYIVEEGIVFRKSFSDKWYVVDFDEMAAVFLVQIQGALSDFQLYIVCQDQTRVLVAHTSAYKRDSLNKAVTFLEAKAIPVHRRNRFF